MNIEIYNEVKKYFFGLNNNTVDENTSINNDLELTGDDAYFSMLHFSKKFEINLSEIDFNRYFLPELLPFKYFYYSIFKSSKLKGKKPPITLKHLTEVIERGKWFDPLG